MSSLRSSSLLACGSLVLAIPALFAQQIGSNSSQTDNGTYKLSVTSQLVVETVVAKDKQGHFINGLSAKDFTITEDGVPQKIRFCEHQTLPTNTLPIIPLCGTAADGGNSFSSATSYA